MNTNVDADYPLIKFIRLLNGDDVVSEVAELGDENVTQYLLVNPLKVVYVTTETNSVQVGFYPWVISSLCDVQEFVVDIENVLTVSSVSPKVLDYYWECIESFNNPKEDEKTEEVKDRTESIIDLLNELSGKRTFH